MGQRQILEFFNEFSGKWFTSEEIQHLLSLSTNSANTSLRAMIKGRYSTVKRRKRNWQESANYRRAMYEYTIK